MKSLLITIMLCLSTSAFANTPETVFKRDSNLPVTLQERIIEAIQAKCGNLTMPYSLSELSTTVRQERIDQGVVDYFYSTTFSSRYYFDGMHPSTTYIEVQSAEYAFYNGDNLSVLSVESQDGCQAK